MEAPASGASNENPEHLMSIATPETELPRDRWGRPLITPPEGGEPVPYTRVTTFAGTLEDTYNLQKWGKRMVAKGMVGATDLLLGAAAADPQDKYGKKTLDEIAERAVERANGTAAATTGTALHSFSEKIDLDLPLGYVPEEFLADLDAYKRLTAENGFKVLGVEKFCVFDLFKIGGTYDRLLDIGDLVAPDGTKPRIVIGDLKTGNIEFGALKIAMQLSTYAHSVDYDHRDGSRSEIMAEDGTPVSRAWGVVIHLPAGSGSASLHWVDLSIGRQALDTAKETRALRARSRDLITRFAVATSGPLAPPSLVEMIQGAETYDALKAVYTQHRLAWTPGLTSLADEVAKRRGWK